MSVIDFHSHILPGIDDGSRDRQISEKMLEMSENQGVNIMVATPHFYASHTTMENFLRKRTAAFGSMKDYAEKCGLRLLPGAEVAFFSGMSRADGLESLTIAGTMLLLLEMPFRSWSSGDIREVEKLLDRGLTPVIAHMERFYPYQKDKHIIDELYALPVLVQINAEALLIWRTKRLALKLFREGKAQLLGSDCHNLLSRPPNLTAGRNIIERKLGVSYLERMDRLGKEVLKLL